ncbi:hypothetical protein A11A3_13470 [Alcanivorax hongdengensis A-11-3]|uniref:Uncharacterized protein n=1 Tax=Alcanivorax hongdengensis A-11-3 TaxID=1177179 RepID=L0WBK3_9GAMM|nr:hypothetical protein [Alcanivorax hongdengensis]EKF73457.1 hypothetical protein A11A3_13470 [Alcanivorax hongdengensis A-11-3]
MGTQIDYIGMWYQARARQGVDDSIPLRVFEPEGDFQQSFRFRHRDHDGIGVLFHFFRQQGMALPVMPVSRESGSPAWWRWLLGSAGELPPVDSDIPWRSFDGHDEPSSMQTLCLSQEQTDALLQRLKQNGVSLNAALLRALQRAVDDTLLAYPVRGSWLYPVNMRGAVPMDCDEMNLSSAFYTSVSGLDSLAEIADRLRRQLRANLHWRMWHLARIGRFVGRRGVNWLSDRMANGQQHLGSFSNLGHWQVDMASGGFPEDAVMAICAPGSPRYPVANGVLIVNGRMTLSMKLHESLGAGAVTAKSCLRRWQFHLEDA